MNVTALRRDDAAGSGHAARLAIRAGGHCGRTAGLTPCFVQGNLAILPAPLASDFLRFCQLNPKPRPLIGPRPRAIRACPARKRVTVVDYPDGRLAIRYHGVDLPYRTFDKRPQVSQAAIVENKRLGPILAYIAEQQKKLDMTRSAKARGAVARRTICSRSDRWTPGRRVTQCEGRHAPPSREPGNQPQPTERRLSCSRPGDISNWPKS